MVQSDNLSIFSGLMLIYNSLMIFYGAPKLIYGSLESIYGDREFIYGALVYAYNIPEPFGKTLKPSCRIRKPIEFPPKAFQFYHKPF